MFNNATLYRITSAMQNAATLDFGASLAKFTPTGPTQARSIGWVEPRPDGPAYAETIAGQIIMAAKIETRSVPADAIAKWVDAAAEKIEKEVGRKPGKKQRQELKDMALLELLPRAFPKAVQVPVWIDPATGLLVVGTASTSQADDILALMVQSLAMTMKPVVTYMNPASAMGVWLLDGEASHGFAIGAELAMKANDDNGETVRYANANLETDEVKDHLKAGKLVQSLGLYYLDRVDFVLTDGLVLKKIMLDVPPADAPAADAFDADVALTTGELAPMLAALIEALDGEVVPEAEADEVEA